MSTRADRALAARRSLQPPRRAARRGLLAAGAVALAATLAVAPADAFRIYLKDGTVVATRDRYRVEGDLAIATLESGAQTTIRLSEIDVEKTDRLNERAYTSAVVIEGGEQKLLSLDDPAMRQRTLAEYVDERRRERARQSARGSSDTGAAKSYRRTPAGYLDLRLVEKRRVEGGAAERIDQTLSRHGLGSAQVFQGTGPDRYLVEVIANSEDRVLSALENLAATVMDLVDGGLRLDALEVYMVTESGSRAGMFTLSEENAALLASDQLEPAQFFVQFVEF